MDRLDHGTAGLPQNAAALCVPSRFWPSPFGFLDGLDPTQEDMTDLWQRIEKIRSSHASCHIFRKCFKRWRTVKPSLFLLY